MKTNQSIPEINQLTKKRPQTAPQPLQGANTNSYILSRQISQKKLQVAETKRKNVWRQKLQSNPYLTDQLALWEKNQAFSLQSARLDKIRRENKIKNDIIKQNQKRDFKDNQQEDEFLDHYNNWKKDLKK